MTHKLSLAAAVALAGAVALGLGWYGLDRSGAPPPPPPAVAVDPAAALVRVHHLPRVFGRRAGDFTANVTGATAPGVTRLAYRLNDDPWVELRPSAPRTPPPDFTIELPGVRLQPGANLLAIRAEAPGRPEEVTEHRFVYDPTPVTLPRRVDWVGADLEAQDGHWEAFEDGGVWRVRPVPGAENYDRLLVVTGAFAGGRRISTDVVFHGHVGRGFYGFGVLPLWGGHPDDAPKGDEGVAPRRGWSFSLGWYYSLYRGIGSEFSYKYGAADPDWVSSYRRLDLEPGQRYRVVTETWAETGPDGRHARFRQRLKWWAADEAEPAEWLDLTDDEGARLPAGEYAVALVSYRSQVEFGPIEIEPLPEPPAPPAFLGAVSLGGDP